VLENLKPEVNKVENHVLRKLTNSQSDTPISREREGRESGEGQHNSKTPTNSQSATPVSKENTQGEVSQTKARLPDSKMAATSQSTAPVHKLNHCTLPGVARQVPVELGILSNTEKNLTNCQPSQKKSDLTSCQESSVKSPPVTKDANHTVVPVNNTLTNSQQEPVEDFDQAEPKTLEVQSPSTATTTSAVLKEEDEDGYSVCYLKSSSQFILSVEIEGQKAEAVVDCGAEVTIISEKLYESLPDRPKKLKDVKLYPVGNHAMRSFVVGPVKIKIGTKYYTVPVFVAPMQFDMLLGVDILKPKKKDEKVTPTVLKMGDTVLTMAEEDTLSFDGQVLPLNVNQKTVSPGPTIARVTVAKRRVVPPNSVAHITCEMDENLKSYIIEPSKQCQRVLIPRTVHSEKSSPVVCVVNPSDKYVLLKKGTELAQAQTVGSIIEENSTDSELCTNSAFCANVAEREEDEDHREVPEHLKAMFDASVKHLDPQQTQELAGILREYEDVFATSEFDLGSFTEIEHAIDTGDAKPIKQRMRRTPACFEPEEEAHLKKMLDAGVIRESISEWASPPVLIRKRDGSVRWCIDYRALNNVTVKDVFPLPLVDDCLDTLAGSVWFSKLDANSAYWQIKLKEEDCKKTAFLTKYGLFEHVKMGFGLCNAPATFSRVMNLVLRGFSWTIVLAFLDDILVLGTTSEDHLSNLREVLARLRRYGLKLKPKKCVFFQKEVEFLGRNVTGTSLAMTEQDTKVVCEWPTPTCSKDVERFMGLANYHRGFVKNFANLADPLYQVVGKNKFRWDEEQQRAFELLKLALTTPPVLALPNRQDEFILDTDASDIAIGAELIQVQNGEEKVIAYASFALTQEQRRYCVTRKELLAVVRFTRQFRHYILGRKFLLRTDHSSLTWLLRFKEPQGQLARWMEELSQYTIIIQHRAGKNHGNADALSRIPEGVVCRAYRAGVRLRELPCGGCDYCTRADKQWGSFTCDVDDAVPLATGRFDEVVVKGQCSCICTEEQEVQEVTWDGHTEDEVLRVGRESKLGNTVPKSQRLKTDAGDGRTEVLRVASVGPTCDGQMSRGLQNCIGKGQHGNHHRNDVSRAEDDDNLSSSEVYDNLSYGEDDDNLSSLEFEVLPWEYQGLSDGGEGVAHLDVAIDGDEFVVLSIGVSKNDPTVSQSSCWGYTIEELQKAQADDPDLQMLLMWLKDGTGPTEGDLFRASPAVKHYWINKALFKLLDGVLFRQRKDTLDIDLVMPVSLKTSALESSHDLPSSGHQGIARTKASMKEKFFWYNLTKDVTNYVTTCDVCSRNKKNSRYGKCPLTEYQAGAPMERVHIDFMGPLPKTARGNEHILVMVDQFTKWVEVVPLPSQSAEVTAKAAVESFFSRFGYPFQLHSDQGRNFEGKLMAALCETLHIHKTRTTPYRPAANGQAERYNRTLMDAIRCFIGKSQNDWDLHLQQLTGAIRSSVNRSTGHTANKLMLGREVNTPSHLMFPQVTERTQDPDDQLARLTSKIEEAHTTARRLMKTSSRRMKRDYDLKVLTRPYKEGDVVYILDTAAVKGKCKKLRSPWKGPGVISKQLTPYVYRVKLQNAIFTTNHDRMKPCHDRKLPVWLVRWKTNPPVNDAPIYNDATVYCSCRRPCEGRFMIQCDFCDEWYHGTCVNVTASDALNIVRYKCGECKGRLRGGHGLTAH
jgi:transposase InsO family protein